MRLTGARGGKVPALPRSLYGRKRVAPQLSKAFRLIARPPGVSLRPVEVNSSPGAVFLDAQQRLVAVWTLDMTGGQITSISASNNPDKLTRAGPAGGLVSLLRAAR